MQSALKLVRDVDPEAIDSRIERDRLIKEHLPLVRSIAGAVRCSSVGAGVPLDDLVAYGANGLIEAAQRFDPARGVTFDVFSRYRIRGAIVDGIRRQHWLPRRTYKRLCAEQLLESRPANDVAPMETSWQHHGSPGPRFVDLELKPIAPGDGSGQPADGSSAHWDARWNGRRMFQMPVEEDDTLQVQVKAQVSKLPFKERRLLELHYFEGKSLSDAGAELGMKRSWASRLHARAIVSLRGSLEEQHTTTRT
jgi:RNA polymerase sigma factor for flagellar operon FliA